MIINCNGFLLRTLEERDKESITLYGNNRNVWINMRDIFPHPYHIEDAEKIIDRLKQLQTVFAIEYENECIGVIGCFPQTDVYCKTAELGYWLAEPFWKKGIMTEAVKKITAYIFQNFDIVRIYAGVYEWNQGSMKVLEKAGFKKEGVAEKNVFKDGQQVDEHRYALINPSIL